jgi:uncharacterized membrane protein
MLLAFSVFMTCFAVLAGGAAAVSLEYYGIEDTINSDNSVDNSVVLQFKEPIGHLDYQLGFRITNLTTESDFPFADCSSTDTDKGSLISCDFIGMTKSRNKLVLDFQTSDIVDKVNDNFRFSVNYGVSIPIERAFTLIKLPENGILAESVANQSYFPPDGSVITDGRHIMIYWNKYNLTSGDDLQHAVLYNLPGSRDPFFNYVIVLLTVVIIVVMVGIVIFIRRPKHTKRSDVIESVLNRDENRVVSVLKEHGGEAGQKVIVRETDFSKAKVSRLVSNLKGRGVVDIEPISGRENKVKMKTEKRAAEEKNPESDSVKQGD